MKDANDVIAAVAAADDLRAENERLREVIESACRAFGAPGDWGYGTREGDAVLTLHRARAALRDAHPAAPAAWRDVLAERKRQIEFEGWTPEHDDAQPVKLAVAAACYVLWSDAYPNQGEPPALWPWDAAWWKPKDYRQDIVRSGALILAEIERLDRAALREQGGA